MEFSINQILGGVLYIDEEIVCIKRERKFLDVYEFLPLYHTILTLELAPRTNKIGRYSKGICYYQDQATHFHSFSNEDEGKDEGKFYYQFDHIYRAYTSIENRDQIIFEFDGKIEVPILQHGGQKLFLDGGLIQAQQSADGSGVIVYNSLASNGKEVWRHAYSSLTSAGKANLHSQILSRDNKLFFVISGNGREGLFVLDIETGKVIKKFEGLYYEIFKDKAYIYTTQFENILCRINIKTLKLEKWNCNALITENGFRSIQDHRCDVVDNKFCFTQTLGGDKAKLGVLDWEKKELVYKHDFEPKNGAVGSIQVNETRMFVNTQDNVLHIISSGIGSR